MAYVTQSLSAASHAHYAKVLLRAPIEELRRRVEPHDGLFVRVSDSTCTMELAAPTLDILASRILWLGIDFEVIGSEAFRRHLTTLTARLGRARTRRHGP